MAIVKGFLQMTGSIRGVSFYTMTGSDQVIMRTKGGPRKNRIAKGAEFEKLRKHQDEWGGCVQFARGVRRAVDEVYRLADYNLSPPWTGMGKNLIKMDKVSEVGQRQLRISEYKEALEGFNFNKKYPFNTILRTLPVVELDCKRMQAIVKFPRINTDFDLLNIQRLPYFRLILVLGTVSDMLYSPDRLNKYNPTNERLHGMSVSTTTEWFSSNDIIPTQILNVRFSENMLTLVTDELTVLLSIGIEFGMVGLGGSINEVKRAGCAKILSVG